MRGSYKLFAHKTISQKSYIQVGTFETFSCFDSIAEKFQITSIGS